MWKEPILGETNARRQHYVPRFYLKAFANPDGRVRVSDLQESREFATSLDNAAVQSGFYDVKAGDRVYSAEDWLGELESSAAMVLQLLLDNPSALLTLTSDQENTLARFVAAQIVRTPAKQQELNQVIEKMVSQTEDIAKNFFTNQFGKTRGLAKFREWIRLPPHERYGQKEPNQPSASTNFLLSEVQGFANLLRGAPWRIGITKGNRRLYASDNPASRYMRPIRPWWETGAFSAFDYFLPLAPELLLKIERRPDLDGPDREDNLWGTRRRKDFSEWETSMVRHIVSRDAFRYVYGDGLVVPRDCASSCLDRIESALQEFAARHLGYDPSPPPGAGFPVL